MIQKKMREGIISTPTYELARGIMSIDGVTEGSVIDSREIKVAYEEDPTYSNICRKERRSIKKDIDIGLDVFTKRGVLEKVGRKSYRITNLPVLQQYFNRTTF